MNYTSIEQSNKLLELGLSPESADMHYFDYGSIAKPYIGYDANEARPENCREIYKYIPCWSVGALLEVMPKEVSIPYTEEGFEDCNPRIAHPFLEACTWDDKYLWYGGLVDDASCHDPRFRSNSILEIVYNTVVWLLENNYIKND